MVQLTVWRWTVLQLSKPRRSWDSPPKESRVSQEERDFTFSCLLLSMIWGETNWVIPTSWRANLTNHTDLYLYFLWKHSQPHPEIMLSCCFLSVVLGFWVHGFVYADKHCTSWPHHQLKNLINWILKLDGKFSFKLNYLVLHSLQKTDPVVVDEWDLDYIASKMCLF